MQIFINPDKYYFKTANFDEFEELLSKCNWDWDLLEEGSEEQNAALETYTAVEEYSTALRRKFIEFTKDEISLKKVNSTFNKFAPDRYRL